MTMKEVAEYFEKKTQENEEFIRITFYEMRVKYNLSEAETNKFLEIAKNKFENTGYTVYFIDDVYEYNGIKMTVQQNELMVAIKNS